jgi:Uri superfamily endonuclease
MDLLSQIGCLVPGGAIVEDGAVETATEVPGAYALVLHLATPVRFSRSGIGRATLSGWYVYAGSAHGGGGIRARLRRHSRRGKPVHWHVDELTNAAVLITAIAVPNGSECDIVDRLLRSGWFEPALQGFGSSDCRHCPAHLLKPVSTLYETTPTSPPQ